MSQGFSGVSEDAVLVRLGEFTENSLQLALIDSTNEWRQDIEGLFYDAKNRFPDIVWETEEIEPEVDGKSKIPDGTVLGVTAGVNEVWAHKAIVFQYAKMDIPAQYILGLDNDQAQDNQLTDHDIRRLTALNPRTGLNLMSLNILSNRMRPSLYTELLTMYGAKSSDKDDHRDDTLVELRLRETLVNMWRTRLYTDIHIKVPWLGQSDEHEENSFSRFSSHRSVLVSRSPYFRDLLLDESGSRIHKHTPDGALIISLPFPPFTPSGFYLILGFIYSGTLKFRDHYIDLTTTFSIIRGAIYLRMLSLQRLTVAHIAVEMLHGLFHAYLSAADYFRLIKANWSNMTRHGGCGCQSCLSRIPRVLQFALGSNIHSFVLERGARRALVGVFGTGWCTYEFASIPRNIRDSILRNLCKMIVPCNAISLLFAAEEALANLDESIIHSWDSAIRPMILAVRSSVDELLCSESRACFDCDDWRDLVGDGILGSNSSVNNDAAKEMRVNWLLEGVLRAVQGSATCLALYHTFNSLDFDNSDHPHLSYFVRRVKDTLLTKMAPMMSFSTFSHSLTSPDLHQGHLSPENDQLYWDNSSISLYSNISEEGVAWSVTEPDRADYSTNVIAMDNLGNASLYSNPSSRTISTDYGLFYTRLAISQEAVNTLTHCDVTVYSMIQYKE